jgi:hypothetical protein
MQENLQLAFAGKWLAPMGHFEALVDHEVAGREVDRHGFAAQTFAIQRPGPAAGFGDHQRQADLAGRPVDMAVELGALEIDPAVGIGREQAIARLLFHERQELAHQGFGHGQAVGGITLVDLGIAAPQPVVGEQDVIFATDEIEGLRCDDAAVHGESFAFESGQFGHRRALGNRGAATVIGSARISIASSLRRDCD